MTEPTKRQSLTEKQTVEDWQPGRVNRTHERSMNDGEKDCKEVTCATCHDKQVPNGMVEWNPPGKIKEGSNGIKKAASD